MNYQISIEDIDRKIIALAVIDGIHAAYECDGDNQEVIATEGIQ